jgi:hypothetical protein
MPSGPRIRGPPIVDVVVEEGVVTVVEVLLVVDEVLEVLLLVVLDEVVGRAPVQSPVSVQTASVTKTHPNSTQSPGRTSGPLAQPRGAGQSQQLIRVVVVVLVVLVVVLVETSVVVVTVVLVVEVVEMVDVVVGGLVDVVVVVDRAVLEVVGRVVVVVDDRHWMVSWTSSGLNSSMLTRPR